jgi:hypothetical protein
MPCEKTFRRDSSTHVANSTASTLPTTISGDATVAQVTEMLSAHRKDIEAISQSPRRRRELASARNVGLQALTWLQQLHGLDEEYILSRQLYDDLGWLLVAESSEEALISWLLKEGSRMLSAGTFARVKRENYHDSDTHSIRNRRRHSLLGALTDGQIALSLDGTPADAIRFLHVLVIDARRSKLEPTLPLAGPLTALHRAVKQEAVPPISVSLFEDYLDLISVASAKLMPECRAEAMLYHPVAPDPWPKFRRLEDSVARELRSRQSIKQLTWNELGFIYLRVMFLLQLQGAVSEADAVIQVLQKHFETVWHNRQDALHTLEKDPKLQHILAGPGNVLDEARMQDVIRGDDAAAQDTDDLLDESNSGIEEPDYDVSSELLELRSRRRR